MSVENIAEKQPISPVAYPVDKIRADFPVLARKVHGAPLIYLDNAATAQKPEQVIRVLDRYYREYNSNIHRGVHTLSEEATTAYEGAREKVRQFINADSEKEIIFTSGTTESINLVAQAWGRTNLKPDDEIIISAMEHHSNIVPWQLLCEQSGAVLRVVPINDDGELVIEEYEKHLNPRTRLVAIGHISNALGTINPIRRMIDLAHSQDIPVLVDGAQAVPHCRVDVRALDCDFYCFSAHKLFGPTGTGVLYGKRHLLESMPPWKGGGDMIKMVTFEKTSYSDLPYKFEAGTPNIAGSIGLGAAIDYVESVGIDNISRYETDLLTYATDAAATIKGLRIIGTAAHKAGILSFILKDLHPHDLGTILDNAGIAIRTGHHCAMPVMERFGVPATARASLAMYNTRTEVDRLIEEIEKAKRIFQ